MRVSSPRLSFLFRFEICLVQALIENYANRLKWEKIHIKNSHTSRVMKIFLHALKYFYTLDRIHIKITQNSTAEHINL